LASEEIPLLPVIPERLRIAAKQGIVIPFIGAGVSQLGGCPGWDDFATAALRFFLNLGKLDYAQFDQLSRLSARVKLSVAVGLEQQHETKIDFHSILEPYEAGKIAMGVKIYGHLAQLARIFVTTNYDKWLDLPPAPAPTVAANVGDPATAMPSSKRSVHFLLPNFTDASLAMPDTVLHIHGSVTDRDSMMLTTSDYLDRYASHRLIGDDLQENPFLTFLGHLFRTKSVLFIGYSLSELEVLEYVIQKARGVGLATPARDVPMEAPRHYLLQGFFTHEAALMRSFRDYYLRECNIQLLPFSKDQKGWHQLVEVLEYLAAEIPVGGVLPSQQRLEMRVLLE
jgi:SIR2-like domain